MNTAYREKIRAKAKVLGLTVETNCPGDGIRRYYVVLPNGRPDGTGDLQLAGPLIGPKLTEAWLEGFACFRRHYVEKEQS